MKRRAALATGSITALATLSASYHEYQAAIPADATTTSESFATRAYHQALGVISQAVTVALGPVDTTSAATAPEEAPPADTNEESEGMGEHNGANINQSPDFIPPAPAATNPFVEGSGDNCVTVALPISGTQKQYCGDDANGGVIMVYTKEVARLLSGSVGGVIVLMVVISGIQYILSVGNPSRVQSAKSRLSNAIIALVLFVMAFAIINFIVPGGLISG